MELDGLANDKPRRDVRRKPSVKRSGWAHVAYQYCQNTTIHGLRQLTERQPFLVRRILWLVLVLGGTAIFISQLASSIIYYNSYPVSVNVKINYNDTIDFPAVTICNQNAFRMSASARRGAYQLLSDVFGGYQDVNWTQYSDSETPLDQLYKSTAHQANDLIVKCTYDGDECGPDDFFPQATDYGLCYTFNGHQSTSPTRRAKQTGVDGGLRLQLNVEQYEYMPGPNSGAGLKMLLHGPNDIAAVYDRGVAIPPGSHAYLALQIVQIDNLKPPHGKCDDSHQLLYSDYSIDACFAECKVHFVMETCGCVDIFMASGDAPVCTLKQYRECLVPAADVFRKMLDTEKNCQLCPVSCQNIMYQPAISYASLSNYDMVGLLRSNLTMALQEKYINAREIRQRVTPQIVEADTILIHKISDVITQLDDAFDQFNLKLHEATTKTDEMFAKMKQRIAFHLDRGLECVQYITKHDFVRGWEIRKERVLNYVTANFYDVTDSFLRMATEINATVPPMDVTMRTALWIVVDNMLSARLSLASTAYDNVVSANNSYSTGKPMLTYRATIDRRYDMSYISLDILQSETNRQNEYVRKSLGHITDMINSLNGLRNLGKNFTQTSTYDSGMFDLFADDFTDACKGYNYRIFQFEERIILLPLEILSTKITDFNNANISLYQAHQRLESVANSIAELIQQSRSDLWGPIKIIIRMSEQYLNDSSFHKEPLANLITAKETTEIVQSLQNFVTTFRLYTKDLHTAWSTLTSAYTLIWTQMLSESSTQAFYKMIHDDFTAYLSALDREGEFIRIFASMLRTDESAINANYPNMDLLFQMNADFYDTKLENKLNEIKLEFEQLDKSTDVSNLVGNNKERFNTLFTEYQRQMKEFLTENAVDTSFYTDNFMRIDIFMQELSYEQITQQKAYDIINLLGDIGGSLGLFLGASVLSVVEFIDIIIHHSMKTLLLGK